MRPVEPVLYGDGRADDSAAIRLLFNGVRVLDARLEVDIAATCLDDLLPGLYRLKVPSRWPLNPASEGNGRRRDAGCTHVDPKWGLTPV